MKQIPERNAVYVNIKQRPYQASTQKTNIPSRHQTPNRTMPASKRIFPFRNQFSQLKHNVHERENSCFNQALKTNQVILRPSKSHKEQNQKPLNPAYNILNQVATARVAASPATNQIKAEINEVGINTVFEMNQNIGIFSPSQRVDCSTAGNLLEAVEARSLSAALSA